MVPSPHLSAAPLPLRADRRWRVALLVAGLIGAVARYALQSPDDNLPSRATSPLSAAGALADDALCAAQAEPSYALK